MQKLQLHATKLQKSAYSFSKWASFCTVALGNSRLQSLRCGNYVFIFHGDELRVTRVELSGLSLVAPICICVMYRYHYDSYSWCNADSCLRVSISLQNTISCSVTFMFACKKWVSLHKIIQRCPQLSSAEVGSLTSAATWLQAKCVIADRADRAGLRSRTSWSAFNLLARFSAIEIKMFQKYDFSDI